MTYWQLERPSKRSGKKWKVRVPTSSGRGKTVAFGDASMSDYTLHKDKARRERYRTRHQRDRIDDPYAPGFWSWWSLWGESSDLDKAHAAAVKRAKKILGVKKDEEGNEVATRSNPTSPTLAEVSQVIATFNVPKRLHTEFLKGFAKEWENAPSEDFHAIGRVVLENLGEDAHYYRKLRRRKNPTATDVAAEPTDRVQACFDALLAIVQEQYPSLRCTIEVDESAGERGGHACARAYAFCEDLEDGAFRIAIAGKLNDPNLADDSRVEGLLRHELAHAVLLHTGDTEHTERDADDVAEALFGSPLFYDADDVQTTDPSAPGARRPRPAYLDDENGRTLDTPRPNPYPAGTMHLETVEDVASYLDDCAAQGDAKSPRILASQLSSKSKELAGVQARVMLSLAKAARHCADAVEARMAGQTDRAMTCERMCDRALQEAASPRSRKNPRPKSPMEEALGLEAGEAYGADEDVPTELGVARILGHKVEFSQNENTSRITGWVKGIGNVGGGYSLEEAKESAREKLAALRKNPEWAKKLGSGLYKGARYSAETARDVYQGAREAHRARAHDAAPAGERKNPRRAHRAGSTHTHRLPGIGTLTVRPDPEGGRDIARVEVTKAFASEWDHDMLNRAYLSRDVMDAVEAHRHGSNFYGVDLVYRGRAFTRLYPRGAGV